MWSNTLSVKPMQNVNTHPWTKCGNIFWYNLIIFKLVYLSLIMPINAALQMPLPCLNLPRSSQLLVYSLVSYPLQPETLSTGCC